jgi:hypothetical protein
MHPVREEAARAEYERSQQQRGAGNTLPAYDPRQKRLVETLQQRELGKV